MAEEKTKKAPKLGDYLGSGLKTLGTGLRFGSEIAAGLESREIGRFNVRQADRELKQLNVSESLSAMKLARYASNLEGKQQTAYATSGLEISGSIVDVMADTAAQLELQRVTQREQFAAQRTALEQEKALTKRQARIGEFGAYFRAGAKLGEFFTG